MRMLNPMRYQNEGTSGGEKQSHLRDHGFCPGGRREDKTSYELSGKEVVNDKKHNKTDDNTRNTSMCFRSTRPNTNHSSSSTKD